MGRLMTGQLGLGFYFTEAFGGGVICLRNLEQDRYGGEKSSRYKSAEFAAVAVDELTEVEQRKTFDNLRSSMRFPGVDHTVFMAATNPDGPGLEWVRELWIEKKFPQEYIDAGIDKEFNFVPALPTDNKYLSKDYWNDLRSQDKETQKAWLEGNWYVFSGRAFKSFTIETHVIPVEEVPAVWVRKSAHDYGISAPYCALWGAKDLSTGRLVVYKELYEVLANDRLQAKKILYMSDDKERFIRRWADPHFWDNRSDTSGEQVSAAKIYAQNHVYLSKGNNDRSAGKRQILRMLEPLPDGRPGLMVMENCTHLITQLLKAIHDPKNAEDVYTSRHYEDHCLIAETKVQTVRGEVPIVDVLAGDQVLTRKGYRSVLSSWMEAPSTKVLRVSFSDGSDLTGTGNHPVWVEDKGWVRLDALRYGDIIKSWKNEASQSSSMELPTEGFPIAPTGQTRITTHLLEMIRSMARIISTGTFGDTTRERYPWAIKFITKIKTRLTTSSPILNVFLLRNILANITSAQLNLSGCVNMPIRSGPLQLNGISQKQDMSGTWNTVKRSLPTDQELLPSVNTAEENIKSVMPVFDMVNSVPTTANQVIAASQGLIMKNVPALNVESNSPLINMPNKNAVVVYVVDLCEEKDQAVYNLEVEGENEFYANGILVHNSYDTLRYLLTDEGDILKKPKLADMRKQSIFADKALIGYM